MSETNNKLNLKSQISNSIIEIVKDLTGEDVEVQIEIPSDLLKGDYTTNVALTLFAKLKTQNSKLKTPIELAEEIVKNLELITNNSELFDRVEVAAPGFINFWFSREAISSQLLKVLETPLHIEGQAEKVDRTVKTENEIILEFGDPNPFKEPHIGHLRNFALGESLARLFEAKNMRVIRANYQGDVGPHVAKAIYGLLQIAKLDEGTLEDKIKVLGDAYSFGSKAYEEDPEAKKEIDEINIKVYSAIAEANADKQNDPLIYSLWQKGREWSLEYFEILYRKLGVKYYKYYFESETAPVGKKIVEENTPKVFEKDNGALIYRGEKAGLHTRVFVTSNGNPMYEAKDLALAILKDKDFPDADSLIMTANEQVEYFKVMIAALSEIDKKIADKTTHLSYGFVNLKDGKMSSRTGNVVSAFWLLEETKKRLKNGFKEVSSDVLDQLSTGAVKWSMLKFSRESNISFSIDESIQIEGNSGPYMQYAYARTQSILAKSDKKGFETKTKGNWQEQELALLRLICQFENTVLDAGNSFSPNILCNYLFYLAQNFNQFYEKEKVIGSEREDEKLVIVNAVGEVLKKGLYLLGIEAPKKI